MPFSLCMNLVGSHSIFQIYIVYDKNTKLLYGVAGIIFISIVATLIITSLYLPVGEDYFIIYTP